MRIYTIYDSKAQLYSMPIFQQNNATAIRSFSKAAQQEGHDFHTFAGDYTLFCIGEWDEVKGAIQPLDAMENLGLALNYIENRSALTAVK